MSNCFCFVGLGYVTRGGLRESVLSVNNDVPFCCNVFLLFLLFCSWLLVSEFSVVLSSLAQIFSSSI